MTDLSINFFFHNNMISIDNIIVSILINSKSDSSQPKQVSLSLSALSFCARRIKFCVFFEHSDGLLHEIHQPCRLDHQRRPCIISYQAAKAYQQEVSLFRSLTGNSEIIFDKRWQPSEENFGKSQIREGPLYGLIYFIASVISF